MRFSVGEICVSVREFVQLGTGLTLSNAVFIWQDMRQCWAICTIGHEFDFEECGIWLARYASLWGNLYNLARV